MINRTSVIRYGSLTIDMHCYTLTLNHKKIVLLSKEFKVFILLAQHPNWIFTKKEIYEMVYQEEIINDINNTIYCLIYSLRKKLEPDPKHPKYIKTVRGVGYKFVKVD